MLGVLVLLDAFGGVIGALYNVIFCFDVRCLNVAAVLVRVLLFIKPCLKGTFTSFYWTMIFSSNAKALKGHNEQKISEITENYALCDTSALSRSSNKAIPCCACPVEMGLLCKLSCE